MLDRIAIMNRLLRLLLLIVLGISEMVRSGAQPANPPESFDLDQIDSYLAAEVVQKGRVGLSVALVKDGKVVLAKGYGRAALEPSVPVESATAFGIGSITKQFTC